MTTIIFCGYRKERNILKKKNMIFLLVGIFTLGIIIFFTFFNSNTAKNMKIGNNSSSQEIVDYILNINSYQTEIKVEIESNKNKNLYILKQMYKKDEKSIQEVIEPSNIAGVKLIKEGNKLTLGNSKLSLSSFFENYEYVSDNRLDLSCFIKQYKENEKSNWKEEENQIKMITNQNQEEKCLWIDKTTGKPIKMEIRDINKNTKVYIVYNEVNINT